MDDTEPRARTMTLSRTDTPARDLPFGVVAEVCDVLEFHGLGASALDVTLALAEVIRKTPAEQGGRLEAVQA